MSSSSPMVCPRDGVETRLRCASCAKPICLRCQVRTEAGLKCPDCAATPSNATRSIRRSRTRPLAAALLGVVLVGIAAFIAIRVLPTPADGHPVAAPLGQWRTLPDLASIRGSTTAVLLHDGRVLVAGGGVGSIPLPGSEIFNPSTDSWTVTGTLNDPRRGNASVVLDDGRVLTAGGLAAGRVLASAEVFDEATGRWALVAPMHEARFNETLTLLLNGRVLAAGGIGSSGDSLSSAEVYNPATNSWTPVPGGMLTGRTDQAAQLLSDGRVLLAGGAAIVNGVRTPLSSVELFDPTVGSFTRANSMSTPRDDLTLTTLRNGRVLASGGFAGSATLATAELYDPTTGSWGAAGTMAQGRRLQSASLLGNGDVLVAGGEQVLEGSRSSLSSAEIFEPSSATWVRAASMQCPRSEQAQVTLANGAVLVVAGDVAFPGSPPGAQSCSELFSVG